MFTLHTNHLMSPTSNELRADGKLMILYKKRKNLKEIFSTLTAHAIDE